ncbi:survival factor 1 [Xylaria sp. CBS 124048]|nr:survival factor 1 [Xylaria sp. CBS 124048]
MFNWAKQTLANVVGTEEPIYGPSAIKSVAEDAKSTPYTEISRDDLKWATLDQTSVETQVFYFTADSGHIGLAQIVYSIIAGIRTTVQFNSKIFYTDGSKPHLWCSNPLTDYDFSEDKTSFYAKDCAVELSEDGKSYTIKSMNDERSIINLKLTRTAPGFVAGKDGRTLYGTDLSKPWGSMRHAFWPRCEAEGSIVTADGPIDFKGKALFIMALQGMKPHHAAARWNFMDFQGPTYSAILMEFTTPPSYGTTVVDVGAVVKDGEIITAGTTCRATHVKTKQDAATGWPEPIETKFVWSGTTKDGKAVEAILEGPTVKQDCVDVMAEVPGFVKTIVANAAGTKPYIYQFAPTKPDVLKLKIGDEELTEEGRTFCEATFISAVEAA